MSDDLPNFMSPLDGLIAFTMYVLRVAACTKSPYSPRASELQIARTFPRICLIHAIYVATSVYSTTHPRPTPHAKDAVNAATRNSPGIATPVVLRTDQLDVRGGKLKISPDPWDMAANSLSSVARLGDPDRICIFCMCRPIFSSQAVKLKGGKPVIYLFAPSVVDTAARLTLMRHWHLSAARVHPDGTLTERITGLDVATNHDVPMTPPGFPLLNSVEPSVAQSESFSPTTCDLTPADSVLLPQYHHALPRRGAARTRPLHRGAHLIHNHTHVALRFVPQAASEHAARLEITPAPDVITRVFMIFKGVVELDIVAGEWIKAAGDPARWRLGARWILALRGVRKNGHIIGVFQVRHVDPFWI
ncbi:hypothetical protein C8R44DRAFT_896391 [Mycena epipterygia]|nr:hypothetical protein C8R44DRAFT_896391 [Mycena epipterygia]